MGPYPLEHYGKWKALTNYITEATVARILPHPSRKITSMMGSRHSEMVNTFSSDYLKGETFDLGLQRPTTSRDPIPVDRPKTDFAADEASVAFSEIDLKRSFVVGAAGHERTK